MNHGKIVYKTKCEGQFEIVMKEIKINGREKDNTFSNWCKCTKNYTQLFWAIYFQKNKTINFKHGSRTKRTELDAHSNI